MNLTPWIDLAVFGIGHLASILLAGTVLCASVGVGAVLVSGVNWMQRRKKRTVIRALRYGVRRTA